MFSKHKLSSAMMARIGTIRDWFFERTTKNVRLQGRSWQVEYLVIPAITEDGSKLPPIFNYPGGMTHLLPCIEPFLFLDRRSIHISPLGYGGSSDISDWFFLNDPYHGSMASLQILQALGEREVVVYGHSNASSIVLQMVIQAAVGATKTKIKGILLVNPLGLRKILVSWVALMFPISGMLSRILSWRHDSPIDFLDELYAPIDHLFSSQKIGYELRKSTEQRLPELFQKMQILGIKIPITIIQSNWDWAAFHFPWSKSNRKILQENIPADLLDILYLPGLHNVTLGKDSENLAKILAESLRN